MRKSLIGITASAALALPLALAAPADAAPPVFPFSNLQCSITARATITGNIRYQIIVFERGNSGPDHLFVQVRDNNGYVAAGDITTRLPWVYTNRTRNRPGLDVFTLSVWDEDTGELCSDFDSTSLRRTTIRDPRVLTPVI